MMASFKNFSLLLALTTLFACQTKTSNHNLFSLGAVRPSPLVLTTQIVSKNGQIVGEQQIEYLNSLLVRLQQALSFKDKPNQLYKIILIDNPLPLAYLPGDGLIIISRGLVSIINNEAELAFIIAHEMAHEQLGHFELLAKNIQRRALLSDRSELELEADKYALDIITLANYDPRAALSALKVVYGASLIEEGEFKESIFKYPRLEERIDLIEMAIHASPWGSLSGTVNQREFVAFKLSMAYKS
ncbi:MAG TPA: M48 family metallopeptidase [Oligoflexia bacterium]|nr:M48 family metallopeptidase [Oligoflexia bacterium]HMP26702.1 M48 family metallopeptidase [Oligoflexia bacterium]